MMMNKTKNQTPTIDELMMQKYWMGIGSLRMMSCTTSMGFEPTRGDPNGLAVHRLNRSATMSSTFQCLHPSVQLVTFSVYVPAAQDDAPLTTLAHFDLSTKADSSFVVYGWGAGSSGWSQFQVSVCYTGNSTPGGGRGQLMLGRGQLRLGRGQLRLGRAAGRLLIMAVTRL